MRAAVALALLAVAPLLAAQTAAPAAPAIAPYRQLTKVDPATLFQLEAIRDTAWRAWFANDHKVMERILPANFIGIGWGNDPWQDKAAAMGGAAEFVSGGGKLLTLAFPRTEVHRFGDVAVVYSNYDVSFEMGGKRIRQAGRSTEVFIRQKNGSWIHPSWHLDSGS
jgi:hypothetical protein